MEADTLQKDRLLYVGQKAIINKEGKILILHDPVIDAIDIPGGKVQEGENDFPSALKREVKEETSLTIDIIRPFHTDYWEFPPDSLHRNAGKQIYLIYFFCRYVSGEVKISEEHDWHKWIDQSEIEKYFHTKTRLYNALSDYFRLLKINKI